MAERRSWTSYTADELAAQYSARDAVPEHPAIFERWRSASVAHRQARHRVGRAHLAIAYGHAAGERLDVFLPDDARASVPALHVFLHGGYWQSMSPEDFSWLAEGPNAAGEAFAVLGYPLCPDVTLPALTASVERGFAWLQDNAAALGIDTGRTRVSGHSAGGQLALLVAQAGRAAAGPPGTTHGIDQVVPISGLFELEPLIHTPLNGALGLDAEAARELSPLLRPIPPRIDLEAWVGEQESDEFHRQSRTMVDRWRAAGGVADFRVASGCNHFTVLEALFRPGGPLCGRYPDPARS